MRALQLALLCIVSPAASTAWAASAGAIRLADDPALSPDGKTLAFSWRGDIWLVATEGGVAKQLTQHTGTDRHPAFSPDGSQIAFVSDRETGDQAFVIDVEGGPPRQLTFHTSGCTVEEWYPAGQALLVRANRDHFYRDGERFFRISLDSGKAEALLFDAFGENGTLTPDGDRLLFNREGMTWWRKGYHGSRAAQVWMYEFEAKQFTPLVKHNTGARWPLWNPGGESFYYVGAQSGSFNLYRYDLQTGREEQLTHFEDDSVVFPCISRDGSTIVFRHLFDLYRHAPGDGAAPVRIEITHAADADESHLQRIVLGDATDVAFSDDALEIAFIAGGDLWVMDTELREPRQVTSTPEEERSCLFGPDTDSIYFVSDRDGQSDIWKTTRGDPEQYWWRNDTFELRRLTHDTDVESDLRLSPDGSRISFVKGRGELWTMTLDGKEAKAIVRSWDRPDYDWAPDGKWIVYAINDNDFNRDIWIIPSDGSADPVNVSRHPYDETGPVWRPDGKVIAFTGRRLDRETDIFYLWLEDIEHEKSDRDRKLEKALEKMDKARKKEKDKPKDKTEEDESQDDPEAANEDDPNADEQDKPQEEQEDKDKREDANELPEVKIDFDRIYERVRRVEIAGSTERGLFWSPDSKKLAFLATIDGKEGTYTIEIPEELKPKLLTEKTGSRARWLKEGKQIVWLSDKKPASVSEKGEQTAYPFQARKEVSRRAHYRAAFDLAWRHMRDRFYDGQLGNRNWDAIRRKYVDAAADAPDAQGLATVVNLMLGELNASHLGFYARTDSPGPARPEWNITTAHLGLRFEPDYKGPGLKVRDVLPHSPADRHASRIEPGETVLAIDGVSVDPAMDLAQVLNGPLDRDIHVTVRDADEQTRDVVIRPTSYDEAQDLLYEKWIRDNQKKVAERSKDRLGYVHIRGMNWPSFQKLERELYAVGAGRHGLIIDVRNNGGGFTTDHLLTMLCQPSHAITVPRGGGPGYPQDRRVYATWSKPIVVLCNQNSFSNAEIFSHAIKTLKRGGLVGVPTAGGVISTGGAAVMDVGFIRLPSRGWYVLGTGQDMELNGAVPDFVLWPEPGDLPKGIDVQLDKAIEVLLEDVEQWKNRDVPPLRKAGSRGR